MRACRRPWIIQPSPRSCHLSSKKPGPSLPASPLPTPLSELDRRHQPQRPKPHITRAPFPVPGLDSCIGRPPCTHYALSMTLSSVILHQPCSYIQELKVCTLQCFQFFLPTEQNNRLETVEFVCYGFHLQQTPLARTITTGDYFQFERGDCSRTKRVFLAAYD